MPATKKARIRIWNVMKIIAEELKNKKVNQKLVLIDEEVLQDISDDTYTEIKI